MVCGPSGEPFGALAQNASRGERIPVVGKLVFLRGLVIKMEIRA
jgi:hypothetical protein